MSQQVPMEYTWQHEPDVPLTVTEGWGL